ncbi:hypothetical protein [Pseudomonas sp. MWU12-2323]|uniref:hypothetical protein n=1 Tax=Pseudomonas sp. MWU12-2323 TaxID=2651296 RepID=UPI00128C4F32|nr:hypothetical protein [Pseudomonas sp. MWU12-2323]MPQ69274.1 hypothetical protein [Pseudomonas sp. MWU12-2323]
MKRNFAAFGSGSAAAVNAGTIGIQKDKVVYLDPNAEILYDPAENVRNAKIVDDSIDGLIDLRLTMDGSEQLQPIRVYPLPPEKLDPKRPALKYGIGYGHRRMLSCRLTKKDHPSIGDMPRKVAAVIDVDWLSRGPAYRLRCQIEENTQRVDLNFVELGQAIYRFREEFEKEEGRTVPQRELQDIFHIKEKTLGYLIQAAGFLDLTKTACNSKVLTDLDALVTFDSICKVNEDFANAIYSSLLDVAAPRTRALIRQAKAKIEAEPDFKVDPDNWIWPDSVAAPVIKPAPAPVPALAQVHTESQAANSNVAPGTQEVAGSSNSSGGHNQIGVNTAPANNLPLNNVLKAELNGSKAPVTPVASQAQPPAQPPASGATIPQQQSAAQGGSGSDVGAEVQSKGTIIMVSFKMGADAKEAFTGELLVSRKAKATSMGVVAYLVDGEEETIEVPLKFVELVSINN